MELLISLSLFRDQAAISINDQQHDPIIFDDNNNDLLSHLNEFDDKSCTNNIVNNNH